MKNLKNICKNLGIFPLICLFTLLFGACLTQFPSVTGPATDNEGVVLGPFDTASAAISAFRSANPGDQIVIKDGVYTDFNGNFGSRNGAKGNPIVIRAQTPGGAALTGKSRISISGCSYVTISGFIFRNGYYGAGTSNAAILASGDTSNHIRITDILMDGYHSPNPQDDCRWVRLYGQYNEVDHSTFINKHCLGVTVEICRSNNDPNYALIHYNYFGFAQPVLDDSGKETNGLETVRIGTSERSQFHADSVVENNFFEECDGEIEIISNKSCGNIYRDNVFYNNNGTLSLRQGNSCIVENNIFININKNNMGGVRVMDRDHIVRNNYFENLGTNKRAAVSMEYAVVDSPLNRYFPVINTVIENNTFVNNRNAIASGPPGSISDDQTIAPTGTKARKNLIVTDANNLQIVYRDTSTPAVAFADTIAWGANLRLVGYGQTPVYNPGTPDGITITDPQMSKNADSLYMPSAQYSAYGMQPDGNSILKREDAGASFARGGVVK